MSVETKLFKTATQEEIRISALSREAYQRWRALQGCPRRAGLSEMTCLQIDLMRWERRNFGMQPAWTSALGIVEEFGELYDATSVEERRDAIGDILVFACNLATKMGIDFDTILRSAEEENDRVSATPRRLAPIVGVLGHVALKTSQGIRGYDDRDVARRDIAIVISRVVRWVVGYDYHMGFDSRETLLNVAETVMKRRWWADPGLGVTITAEKVGPSRIGTLPIEVYEKTAHSASVPLENSVTINPQVKL